VEGVWYGGDFTRIRERIEEGTLPENAIRFFVGYSGWSIGQLQEEITSKSWFVVNVPSKLIMNSKENNVWKEVMERLGPKGKLLSNFPEDPNLN
jgi:putative transcriptional regulator